MRDRRLAAVVAVTLLAGICATATLASAQSPEGFWVAGDLHIHTTYSHDSYGGPNDDNTGPEEAYTLGHSVASQFAVANARGLDYLAITDHNDIRSQNDFGAAGNVVPIAGYENSLSGHAQMLGADKIYDNGNRDATAVNRIAEELRADGGVFQINHPMEGSVDHPNDPDWGYGYDVVPETVEVWNISRLWQPPAPSASSNDDAVSYWEGFLDRGYKVAATGGSDNHYLATTPVQGAGQPTTWVFVDELSEAGVLEGLRNGHTFISHQPPAHAGPETFLEGDSDGDGSFESIVGDTVAAGSQLRVRVVGAPGSQLRVLTDGGVEAFAPVPVTSPAFEHRFTVPEGATWVRAEILEPDGRAEREAACDEQFGSETTYCRNRLLVLGMTSALFLAPGNPDPTVTPTPSAPEVPTELAFINTATTGRYSDETTATVELTDESGIPLAGETIEFTFTTAEGTRSFSATTNDQGVAVTTFTLIEAPGPAELRAHYGGRADFYEGSSAILPFVIDKEITRLDLVTTGNGARTRLTATLTDDEGTAIADRTISFTSARGDICPGATTDANGRALCSPHPRDAKKPYGARFDGDDFYEASTAQ